MAEVWFSVLFVLMIFHAFGGIVWFIDNLVEYRKEKNKRHEKDFEARSYWQPIRATPHQDEHAQTEVRLPKPEPDHGGYAAIGGQVRECARPHRERRYRMITPKDAEGAQRQQLTLRADSVALHATSQLTLRADSWTADLREQAIPRGSRGPATNPTSDQTEPRRRPA